VATLKTYLKNEEIIEDIKNKKNLKTEERKL
jgi:hypothetical protein